MNVVIITGLSGAGKSQAMKAMEDIGYYCVDNLPPVLIPNFIDLCAKNMEDITKIALVVDIRGGRFFNALDSSLEALKEKGVFFDIVFLEASDKALIKRFKESRRTHPLKPYGSIEEGITLEKQRLSDLRSRAQLIIDTSNLNISQFRNELYKKFIEGQEMENMSITITSFGYKKGIPLDADLVFDVRMLPNPFYVEELRPLTGFDKGVQNYVMASQDSERYLNRIIQMVDFLIPLGVKEGRSQFVIAIGCTGGQHRSVTFANFLGEHLMNANHRVSVLHRELKG